MVLLGFLGSVKDCGSIKIANLRSSEMLAVIAIVSIAMPNKVICVVGVTTFSGLIGALMWWHSWSIKSRFCWHSRDHGDPAVRKSSR